MQIYRELRNERSAFSLLEVMIAVTIFSIAIASILSTFIVFAAGSESVGAYVEMSTDSRRSLELCARDIRAAEEITYADDNTIVLQYPDNSFYSGHYVKYYFDDDADIYSRYEFEDDVVLKANGDIDDSDAGLAGNTISNDTLLDGVEEFIFNFYDPLGSALSSSTASLLLSIKSIQIDAKMQRSISQTKATDYIISARFLMRNRKVTQ